MKFKNIWRFVAFAFFLPLVILGAMIGWRARPVMQKNESYNHFFPHDSFLKKVNTPVPEWMTRQIEADFKEVQPITAEALSKAYVIIESKLDHTLPFDHPVHYRILNNQLYKQLDLNGHCSPRDSQYERTLKTLLSHIDVPDLDFILAPMDGVPEPYIDSQFYVMENPEDQVPILAQAKLREPLTKQIILIPDLFSLSNNWFDVKQDIDSLKGQISWNEKFPIAYWRGGLTDKGTPSGRLPKFTETPRLAICKFSQEFPNQIDAGLNWIEPPEPNDMYEAAGYLKGSSNKQEHLRYKYLPVLDGHMCTYPGYQWRLLSDSVCFKQESDQIQWFYSALQPYVHYIPVANDMSDLAEKVVWAQEHDEETWQICKQAQEFASQNLLYEDDYRYLYLVLKKYASLQKIDFKKLKKETTRPNGWIGIHYRKRAAVSKMLWRIYEKLGGSASSVQSSERHLSRTEQHPVKEPA